MPDWLVNIVSGFQWSPALISRLCQITVTLVGSMISPTWQYFELIISPWLNLKALNDVSTALPEMVAFYQKAHHNQLEVATQLLPELLLCLASSIGFLIVCRWAGHYMAEQFLQTKLAQKLVA